jgi:hypothetical protein
VKKFPFEINLSRMKVQLHFASDAIIALLVSVIEFKTVVWQSETSKL